jgi:hypothetical protein
LSFATTTADISDTRCAMPADCVSSSDGIDVALADRVANDFESVESSIRRVHTSLRVLSDDQGTLVVASALDAAAKALSGIRRYLDGGASDPRQMRSIIELIDDITSMLLPLVARRQVAR